MSLRARLLAALTYVLLLAIVAFGVPLGLTLSSRVSEEVRSQARAEADLVAATAGDLLGPSHRAGLLAVVHNAASAVHGRVIVVSAGGGVLADSAGAMQLGVSYESRPELEHALAGHPDQVQRDSRTLHQEILATAVPIVHDGRVAGAVRITQSVHAVHSAVLRVQAELVLIGLVVLAVGLLAGAVLAEQIARPIRRLQTVARRIAQGDLLARAAVEGSREQRFLGRAFNDMTERIERLVGAQQRFVADASHQLRTPLTGLRLRLEEAQARSSEPGARSEIGAALTEVDRLAQIVDELLQLSRDRQRRPEATLIDLDDLADDAAARWAREAAGRQITISRERADGAGAVWAARPDLERALDALIDNALRYSPASSAVTIVTGPRQVEVRDRGLGIGEDERLRVFDRFHRGRAGRTGGPGHGLGLPIARELLAEWGGEVSLTARPAGGTRATIRFAADHRPGIETDGEFARA